MVIKRFEVYFINLDPTVGSEINKIRPCVVISPDQFNNGLNTVIVAPLTSTIKSYPTRVNCYVDGRRGQICLDQMRTVDKRRLQKLLDVITDDQTQQDLLDTLYEIFAP